MRLFLQGEAFTIRTGGFDGFDFNFDDFMSKFNFFDDDNDNDNGFADGFHQPFGGGQEFHFHGVSVISTRFNASSSK